MKKNSLLGESMLLLAAFIWGIAFVAQSVGGNILGTFTFSAIRMFIGGFTLLPCIFLLNRNSAKEQGIVKEAWLKGNKTLVLGGLTCGTVLFIACNLQQIGLHYSGASKAGFITALYIIIVPIIGIFLKKRPPITLWFSILIALVGMYLLCLTKGFYIESGDLLLILSAFAFSIHILVIDYFSPLVDGVKLSCIQFFVCGFLSFIAMLFLEHPTMHAVFKAWLPLLYTGILSCGVAYTFQILGQKRVNHVVSSLLMSLESVFSALGGWLILGDSLSARELAGCIILFAAIILAQIPIKPIRLSGLPSDDFK